MKPQIDSVNNTYDLVLMTIGGNDVNFAEIAKQCLVAASNNASKCNTLLKNASGKLKDSGANGVREKVARSLGAIDGRLNANRANRGQIVLLSYPYLIRNHDYTLDGVQVGQRLMDLTSRREDRRGPHSGHSARRLRIARRCVAQPATTSSDGGRHRRGTPTAAPHRTSLCADSRTLTTSDSWECQRHVWQTASVRRIRKRATAQIDGSHPFGSPSGRYHHLLGSTLAPATIHRQSPSVCHCSVPHGSLGLQKLTVAVTSPPSSDSLRTSRVAPRSHRDSSDETEPSKM